MHYFLNADPDSRIINGNVLNELIYTPGNVQMAVINIGAMLQKTVDLTPFNIDPAGVSNNPQNPLYLPKYANDIIYGGLGDDWLHGGSGDDAISGAEALPVSYTQRWATPCQAPNSSRRGAQRLRAAIQQWRYAPLQPR